MFKCKSLKIWNAISKILQHEWGTPLPKNAKYGPEDMNILSLYYTIYFLWNH